MEKDLLVLELENGETKEFYKLAEFVSITTKKKYIIMTDKDSPSFTNIYFNILEEVDGVTKYKKVESKEDKEECKKAFEELLNVLSKKE